MKQGGRLNQQLIDSLLPDPVYREPFANRAFIATMAALAKVQPKARSINFALRRVAVGVITLSEPQDRARRAIPRISPAAAGAGQNIMTAAIVPLHQVGLDGLLAQHHDHGIVNQSWRDVSMRVDFLQGFDQPVFVRINHAP